MLPVRYGVSIPDRVLGFLCHCGGTSCESSMNAVSIPDRVLGFLCLSIAETLLYLVFKLQFCES